MNVPVTIDVQKLSHNYGTRRALDRIELQIASVKSSAVLGPNGGGKTTLFRVLSTLIAPQEGEVHINGLDLKANKSNIRPPNWCSVPGLQCRRQI